MPLTENAKITAVSSDIHITGKENSFAGHAAQGELREGAEIASCGSDTLCNAPRLVI